MMCFPLATKDDSWYFRWAKTPTKQRPRSGWIFSFLVVSVSIAFLVLTTLGRGRQWQERFGSMNRDVFEIWNTNMWIEHWAWKCLLKYICEILWICYPNMIENLDWTKNKGGHSGAESPTKIGSKVPDFFHQTIGISGPAWPGFVGKMSRQPDIWFS